MMPSGLHVPPRAVEEVSVCGDPPARSRRFSLDPSKKPIDRLSGDQNGKLAPSVPASGCAVDLSSGLSHSREALSPEATKTICRPSGERAKEIGSDVAGVTMSVRVSGGSGTTSRRYLAVGI